MKIRVMFRVIVCGLLLALLVPAAKVAAAKPSKQRVKIGVLVSLTGSWSSLGKNTVAALRIAAADLENIHPQYRRPDSDSLFAILNSIRKRHSTRLETWINAEFGL
jgi:hypothetical protein